MADGRHWFQDTPIGAVLVTVSDAGLRGIRFRATPSDAADLDSYEEPDASIAAQLDEWFGGTRTAFDVVLDLDPMADFQRVVLETLHRSVAWGETVTYGELAGMAGRPRAARAVGSTMAMNPVPFVIPCHRVVASTGIGGYGGTADSAAENIAIKRWLLRHEGTPV